MSQLLVNYILNLNIYNLTYPKLKYFHAKNNQLNIVDKVCRVSFSDFRKGGDIWLLSMPIQNCHRIMSKQDQGRKWSAW